MQFFFHFYKDKNLYRINQQFFIISIFKYPTYRKRYLDTY